MNRKGEQMSPCGIPFFIINYSIKFIVSLSYFFDKISSN